MTRSPKFSTSNRRWCTNNPPRFTTSRAVCSCSQHLCFTRSRFITVGRTATTGMVTGMAIVMEMATGMVVTAAHHQFITAGELSHPAANCLAAPNK